MKDMMKRCGRCRHEHVYGIVRHSADNVPLYGARRCKGIVENAVGEQYPCNCGDFVEYVEGIGENQLMLSVPPEELNALWAATSFLSPQTPMATRIAVRQINSLEGPEREKEFMGLMISQMTDIRAAMTKDESKFANLVSHTDEVVESMRGVVQLSERLQGVNRRVDNVDERLDKLEIQNRALMTMLEAISEKLGVESVHVREAAYPSIDNPEERPEAIPSELASAARRVFTQANSHLRDEAVVVDGVPSNDD